MRTPCSSGSARVSPFALLAVALVTVLAGCGKKRQTDEERVAPFREAGEAQIANILAIGQAVAREPPLTKEYVQALKLQPFPVQDIVLNSFDDPDGWKGNTRSVLAADIVDGDLATTSEDPGLLRPDYYTDWLTISAAALAPTRAQGVVLSDLETNLGELTGLKYLVVLRQLGLREPVTAGGLFVAGVWAGEALVFELATRRLVVRFAVSARNDDQVADTGALDDEDDLLSDLRVNLLQSLQQVLQIYQQAETEGDS
jgi:hypothetical protein